MSENYGYLYNYGRWLHSDNIPTELHDELVSIKDDEVAQRDRFWCELSFGTGGLRGKLGAGTNRINELVVQRATYGLTDYIKANKGKSVCIAYDTRNKSHEFAEVAAEVLCANGLNVYLFASVRPTPMLSFAVREKHAFSGIVITASHNPREYNGYKVYGADGGQITDNAAKLISESINLTDLLWRVPRIPLTQARQMKSLFDLDDVDTAYYENVKSLVIRKELVANNADKLSILYTPLHGTGNIPVRRVLNELGFTDFSVVKEQELPDGNFPTVLRPNPEEPETFKLALRQANGQDIILATDPDCDRIGVRVKTSSGEYATMSGNQVGALLCEYIISAKRESGTLCDKSAIVKTVVTTELARNICNENGIALIEVLTGFKYIGEKIEQWQKNKQHIFLFGFEESYGYLVGNFVRDKDAVIAATLICEMALFYKLKGWTLVDALENLYSRYGYCDERLVSATLDGEEGMQKVKAIMKQFREEYVSIFEGRKIAKIEDYLTGIRGFPRSDVVKFKFADGCWLAVRPSGTEPKIKFYVGAVGKSKDEVILRLTELNAVANSAVGGNNVRWPTIT